MRRAASTPSADTRARVNRDGETERVTGPTSAALDEIGSQLPLVLCMESRSAEQTRECASPQRLPGEVMTVSGGAGLVGAVVELREPVDDQPAGCWGSVIAADARGGLAVEFDKIGGARGTPVVVSVPVEGVRVVWQPTAEAEAERSPLHRFDIAIARWVVGVSPPAAVPEAAIEGLARGATGEALEILAGMSASSMSEIEMWIDRVLAERGQPRPTEGDAWTTVVDDLVERVLHGEPEHEQLALVASRVAFDFRAPCLSELVDLYGHWYGPGDQDETYRRSVTRAAVRLRAQGGVHLTER